MDIVLLTVLIFTTIPISAFADAPQFADYPVTETHQGSNHLAIPHKYFDDSFNEHQKALTEQKINYAGCL